LKKLSPLENFVITSVEVPKRFFDKAAHHLMVDGGIRTVHIPGNREFDLLWISKGKIKIHGGCSR
jgi:hypothetical protein